MPDTPMSPSEAIEEAREALKPFASLCGWGSAFEESTPVLLSALPTALAEQRIGLVKGDFDRASRALAALSGEGEADAWQEAVEIDLIKLQDRETILINMMRGTIAKVAANSLHKLYTEDELLEAARNAAGRPTPALSGLTEEERAEGPEEKLRTIAQDLCDTAAKGKDTIIKPSAVEAFAQAFTLSADILAEWKLRGLSPAPGIDWKKAGEVIGALMRTSEGFMEAVRADTKTAYPWEPYDLAAEDARALLSELAKIGGGE